VVHLKRWADLLETFPVGPNRSIQFLTEIPGYFGGMESALCFHSFSRCDWFAALSHDFDENKCSSH